MKKKLILFPVFALTLILSSCGGESWSSILSSSDTYSYYSTSEEINSEDYGLADRVEDGEILHAWNWKISEIERLLPQIAAAGFSTIQTSPMQPQKDYLGEQTWTESWWKLYQPLGFSIATKNHSLGTKDDLISLCEKADEYGIRIIVDVVANHLAGGTPTSFHQDVEEYERDIYRRELLHKPGSYTNDSSTRATVRGSLGEYPDLQTEDTFVQERVLSLLKEYIDCGVDGFRFDAAKHIETPSDGEYASSFWPTVIGGAKTYYSEKEEDELYVYGEILNNVGGQSEKRSVTYYTPYMDFTETNASTYVRNNAVAGIYTNLAKEDILTYEGVTSDNVLLWAESHDTYANDVHETTNILQADIDRAYAVLASRNDFPVLYFARPSEGATLGSVSTYAWQSEAISEINRFHNQFIGCENHLSSSADGSIFLNEKDNNGDYGAVLVLTPEEGVANTEVSLPVTLLEDGTYIDQISGNEFEVKSGILTGEVGETGIVTLFEPKVVDIPVITVSNDGSMPSYDPIPVHIEVRNAESSYYQIDVGEEISFSGETDVTLGEEISSGRIHLRVVAENEAKKVVQEYTYTKRDPNHLEIEVVNIDNEYINNRALYAWVWKSGSDGRWVSGTKGENSFRFAVTRDDTHFLLASFPNGMEVSGTEDVWDECISQTSDVAIGGSSMFDAQSFTWRAPL